MSERVRLFFALQQDEDGYPPVAAESLWAISTGRSHEYILDNIPFFARQATSGDVVQAMAGDGGVLWFERMVKPSGKSLLRVTFFQPTKVQEVRTALERIGCATEWDDTHRLVSVSVPPSAELESVQSYLAEQAQAGYLDYEEALLRQ
jgi:Domain of unknown function (DUF4265)